MVYTAPIAARATQVPTASSLQTIAAATPAHIAANPGSYTFVNPAAALAPAAVKREGVFDFSDPMTIGIVAVAGVAVLAIAGVAIARRHHHG